eukprot:1146616-Pelagomonas_calceolata.AAC.3
MLRRWTAKSPGWAPPDRGPDQGHPQKYVDKAYVVWSCPMGLRWPGWDSQNQDFWNLCSQTLPAAPRPSSPASHGPLTPQGCLNLLFGRIAKISGRGVHWVALGSLV